MAAKNSVNTSPNVLIVENGQGEVYIIENKDQISQVEKILKSCGTVKKLVKPKVETQECFTLTPERIRIMKEENQEENEKENECVIEEYLDEYLEYSEIQPETDNCTLETEIVKNEEFEERIEEKQSAISDAMIHDHQYMIQEPTFNGKYSSDENIETIEESFKPGKTLKTQRHKIRQLTGKTACKYCETVFRSKDALKVHDCKYLQCDPKNFICRICNKELSRKTFSNHLHETLDCQYCSKNFVNPRNLKNHIKKMHGREEFIPPKKIEFSDAKPEFDEDFEPVLDETTGMLLTEPKKERKKYPRKKGRYECDLCGRIFTCLKSLQVHMDLHTNNHRYVCQTCGERYATHTGIMKHACLNKKRKRPEVDFRIFDVRHCKYCGKSFANFDENKSHACEFQFPDDPKLFRCRFCFVDIAKSSYNKHVTRHLDSDIEWVCGFCEKKLSDENALNVHLTTHTGDRPYKCNFDGCNQSFINKQLLTRHSRFHGIEIPVHTCKICNKEVASKYHLKAHMKLHESFVECQLCRKECESREDLKQHYQDNHEPYPCSYCEKVFVLPRYLKMHEKLHNPAERPHSCTYCSKAFSKVALLMNHVFKVHANKFEEFKIENPEIFRKTQ